MIISLFKSHILFIWYFNYINLSFYVIQDHDICNIRLSPVMRDRKNTDNLLRKWHWFVSFIWGQASTVDVVFYSPLALLCVFVYQILRKRISRTIRTDLFHRDVQGINSLNLSVKIASLTPIWLPFIKILLDFHWISLRLHNTTRK